LGRRVYQGGPNVLKQPRGGKRSKKKTRVEKREMMPRKAKSPETARRREKQSSYLPKRHDAGKLPAR